MINSVYIVLGGINLIATLLRLMKCNNELLRRKLQHLAAERSLFLLYSGAEISVNSPCSQIICVLFNQAEGKCKLRRFLWVRMTRYAKRMRKSVSNIY